MRATLGRGVVPLQRGCPSVHGPAFSGVERAPRLGTDSPRWARLISPNLCHQIGVSQQRRLVCRRHDSKRDLVGFVIHA